MDQFDRGSRMRQAEEAARERLHRAERARNSPVGHRLRDPDAFKGRLLFVALVLIVALVVAFALNLDGESQPRARYRTEGRTGQSHMPSGPAAITRVQVPAWLQVTPPPPLLDAP